MKNKNIQYGIIAGLIVLVAMFVSVNLSGNELTYKQSEIIGVGGQFVAFSTIVFAILKHKKEQGSMSFGEAFKIGMIITVIATAFWVIGWLIYVSINPEVVDAMFNKQMDMIRSSGGSEEEIAKKLEDAKTMIESYKNPLVKIVVSIIEIFPTGIAITLVTALFAKTRKR